MSLAAVSAREDADDGEAEARTGGRARRVAPAEGLERVLDEVRGETRAVIMYVQLDTVIVPVGPQDGRRQRQADRRGGGPGRQLPTGRALTVGGTRLP